MRFYIVAVIVAVIIVLLLHNGCIKESYNNLRRNWYWRMSNRNPQWLNRRWRRSWPFQRLHYWWNPRTFYHPFYHRNYRGFY